MTAVDVERARVSAVADYIRIRPQANEDLYALCELAALVCDVPNAAVNLVDDRIQHQVAAFGVDPSICAKDDSMCAVTIAGGQDLHVDDASRDPRFARNPWVDGRLAEVKMYAAALLRSPEGHFVGTLCVFDERSRELAPRRREALSKLAGQVVDVLELQRVTRNLARTVEELNRSQEQLTAFAGQVSHDLKTPLTASMGYAELLAELPAVGEDPVAKRYADRCVSTSHRMLAMIDELLAYARVGGRLNRQPVSLDELMPLVIDDLGGLADDVDITWTGAPVTADPVQLRALLQNLVGNAATYRRPGVPCVVRIESIDSPIGTELMISDNGSGIPAHQRQEVLAPLARLRTDVPGTGLGLATVARIVAAHSGTLHLDETPGGGLTVTVLFPA